MDRRRPGGCARPLWWLVLALLPAACAGSPPSPPETLPPAQAAAIDRFVSRFTDLAMFDGVVLVDVGGAVVYRRAFGYANHALGVRHAPGHRFRIASVSKAVTDVAIARLVADGTLDLDAPIARWLPDFPSADLITVRHLLRHQSGIPHTNRQPWGDGSLSLSTAEIVARLAALPLDFPPGTQTAYSNGGYAVAARILELDADAPLTDVLDRALFTPLGMTRSGHLADSRVSVSGMVTGYEPGAVPGQRRHPRFYAVESRPGGGSLYATADDVLRFLRGVFRGGFVSAAVRREALGERGDVYLSQGRSPGFVAKAFHRASDDMIVVSLANSYAVPADWAAAIAGLAAAEPVAPGWIPFEPVQRAVPVDHPWIGDWRSSFGDQAVAIRRTAAGHLTMAIGADAGERPTALVPLADGGFLMPLFFQHCADGDGGVITCRMLSGDARYTSTLRRSGDRPPLE